MLRYSVFVLPVLVLAGASESAQAACVRDGATVTCNDQDTNGYVSPFSSGIRLTVNPGATLYNTDIGEFAGDCDELSPPSVWLGDDSTVTNGGTITTQGVCGWAIALGDRGAVVNRGRIVTYGALGVGVLAGDGLVVTNAGGISTQGQAGYGVFAGDRATITTETGSFIVTTGAGAAGIAVHDNGIVNNAGRIETMDDAADGITAGAGATLRNTGVISTHGAQAAGLRAAGGTVAITNTGQISAVFTGQTNAPAHTFGIAASGDQIDVTNTGTIAASFAAAQLTAARFVSLTNTGVMSAAGERRNDGSFAAGGAAILAAAGSAVTIVNTGQITGLNGQAAIRVTNGSVSLSSSGAITGDIVFGGGDDQFKLDGGTFQGTFDAGGGMDTLLLAGNGDLAAPLLNVENLSKSGPGTWTLHKAVTFTGQANILDGVLILAQDAAVTTPALNIITSGTLAGSGAVAGTVDNAGLVAPGLGAGTSARLSILGAYIQRAEGTLALRVNSDGANDSLAVGGTAVLGGTLRITYDPALARSHFTGARSARIILAADRGLAVQGNFARVQSNAPFIDNRVSVTATGVDLTFSRLSYGAAAANPNQRAAGAMLDRMAGTPAISGALDSVIAALDAGTPETAVNTLAAFTPETVPAVQNLGLFTLQSLREAQPSGSDQRISVWGDYLNRHGSAPTFRYDLNGGVAGLSMKAGENLSVGALLARTSGDAAFTAAKGDLNGSFAGLTLAYDWSAFTAVAGVIYGAAHPETRRTQALLGTTTTLSARGSADLWSVYGAVERLFDLGPVTVTPRAGLARDSISLGRFDETAPLSALVQASDTQSLRAELGVRGEAAVAGVRPYVGLKATRELGDGRRDAVVQITGVPGSDFLVGGPRPRGFAMVMDGGLAVDLAPGLAARASARFTANDVFAGRSISAGLTYRW